MDRTDGSEEDQLEPSINNIICQDSLKWIFVGGKGGVGKTTCSCSLAVQLAKVRKLVLLLSTDPTHNISDAFQQQFTKTPTKVEGFTNLYAMEVNPEIYDENESLFVSEDESNTMQLGRNSIPDIMATFLGIDEFMSYAQIIKLVKSMNFSVVIFDTTTPVHTLRLLTCHLKFERTIEKLVCLKNTIGPLLNLIHMFFGADINLDDILRKLEGILSVIRTVNQQFTNPDQTTFVCVCIAEFLSLNETERLVQKLIENGIDTHNIIVNQLYFNNIDSDPSCRMCSSKRALQHTYLKLINDLYMDFHVTKLPLMAQEVRCVADITEFSKYLVNPRNECVHLQHA